MANPGYVAESAIVDGDMQSVWQLIRTMSFKFCKNVSQAKKEEGEDLLNLGQYTIAYSDNTVQSVRVIEVSERLPNKRSIGMEFVSSDPPVSYSGRLDLISVTAVTHSSKPCCLIEFSSDFTSDATTEVLEDSKFKKREFFDDLQGFLSSSGGSVPRNPLKIGATIPNFDVVTTKGNFKLHDWLSGDASKPWTLFFSHPKDYTPVCTTELGECHNVAARFGSIGVKLLGVSCDSVEDHHGWSKDVLHRIGKSGDGELAFPIIADSNRKIVSMLGMLDPEEIDAAGVPLPARALVVLQGSTVKLTILYPATTGRNFDEIFRVVTSLQLTAGEGLATPVNWKYAERVIVGPPVKTEDAKAKFTEFQQEEMPSGKPYLRSVACPPKGMAAP